MTREKVSCDFETVKPHKESFTKTVKELNLTVDEIYSANESGLF